MVQRGLGRRRRASTRSGPGSSTRRATTTATGRIRRRRPAATTASRSQARPLSSAPSAAWRRAPGSPRTRRSGRRRTPRPRVATHVRPRGGDRPGCRRRRGRHQLLDQRHADELPRPGRDLVPLRRQRWRLRRGIRGQQRPDHLDRRPPVAVDHHGGGWHAQPERRRLRDAWQRRRRTTAPRWPPRLARCRSSTRRQRADRRGSDAGCALLQLTRRGQRPRPGEGRRQDRRLRPRRDRPRQQEPRRPGGRWRRDDPRQHERQLAQRRLPLRSDRPPPEHRPRGRQGLRGDGRRHRDDQPGDDRLQRPGAVHGELLVARPAPGVGRPPEAGRHRPRPGHPGRRLARRAAAAWTSTCTAARRCRAHTWPASRRCSRTSTPTGRR